MSFRGGEGRRDEEAMTRGDEGAIDLASSLPRLFASYLLISPLLPITLWVLLALFCLRVIGQMLVAFGGVSFLPPMEAWYSGLLPYPLLLPSQFIIILLYGKVCLDFTRRQGFFYTPQRSLGKGLLIFGALYFGVMVIRFLIRLSFYQGPWWMGGTIPIFFHWVLAGFILLVGSYHWAETNQK